jgi:hypothetical protein
MKEKKSRREKTLKSKFKKYNISSAQRSPMQVWPIWVKILAFIMFFTSSCKRSWKETRSSEVFRQFIPNVRYSIEIRRFEKFCSTLS